MPDAARLVAALCLGLVGFFLSGVVMEMYTRTVADVNYGWFVYINVVLGVLVGWSWVGKRAGRGVSAAVTNGITGVAVVVFWGLLIHGGVEMIERAMKNRYDNAFEALTAVFEIGAEWGVLLFTAPILIVAGLGAFVVGILTEYAWRTWR